MSKPVDQAEFDRRPPNVLPPIDDAVGEHVLGELLRDVSRSFYLTIRVLPKHLRAPVGLAYLLARAADTVADTKALPPDTRLERLLSYRKQVRGPASLDVLQGIADEASPELSSPQERALLDSLSEVFALVESMPVDDQERIRPVVTTLIQGMELDLTTFPAEDSGEVAALATGGDLDRYMYLVAGCVGEFWTAVTTAHEPRLGHWDEARMSGIGVRFGKALQLTNVLRDVPRDLRIGRCYLPADELTAVGLSPQDLLIPGNSASARQVLVPWIDTALGHFDAAQEYLLAIPRRCARLRLAVFWPILLGLGTLERLARNEQWLDPATVSKVSRRWVYWMMLRSWPAVSSDAIVRRWIGGLRARVVKAL